MSRAGSAPARRLNRFVLMLLVIECLDELVFSAREAAWPLIRDDFRLTYAQIGLLLSVPGLISAVVEPALGILADVWHRRVLIVGGAALPSAGRCCWWHLAAVSGR